VSPYWQDCVKGCGKRASSPFFLLRLPVLENPPPHPFVLVTPRANFGVVDARPRVFPSCGARHVRVVVLLFPATTS